MTAAHEVQFRIAGAEDAGTLADMRLAFLCDTGFAGRNFCGLELKKTAEGYFLRHIEDCSYIPILGCMNGIYVCCAGILLYELPPFNAGEKRIQGHVLNFYVIPEAGGKGVGTAMMEYLIAHARTINIKRLFLNATPAGEALYRKLGFHEPGETTLILDL